MTYVYTFLLEGGRGGSFRFRTGYNYTRICTCTIFRTRTYSTHKPMLAHITPEFLGRARTPTRTRSVPRKLPPSSGAPTSGQPTFALVTGAAAGVGSLREIGFQTPTRRGPSLAPSSSLFIAWSRPVTWHCRLTYEMVYSQIY